MPQPNFHGHIYCETGHPWLGMAEPVNTLTNVAILIAAYFAYRYVKKSRVGFSADLVLLLFLLAWVGIGSALWHGLRTSWALHLDWIPGVLFLIVLTVLWFRQLFGWYVGALGATMMYVGVIASVALTRSYFGDAHGGLAELRAVPGFAVITLFGAGLVMGTAQLYGRQTAMLGGAALACGVFAAIARSIDLIVCPFIPTGTHFLWHIGLSTAACLGILLVVRIKKINNEKAFLPPA